MAIVTNPAVWFAASIFDSFTDNTFGGLYRLQPFDWAILIPYFGILIILSVYGCHRYEMIRGYYKHREKIPTEPPGRFERLPRVTVQLPIYNERYVVERLVEEAVKIDYPRELLQIQVLDDSTDDTHPFTEQLVAQYQAQGYPIVYLHRANRHGYKAGALQEGLKSATGEFVAIFDADFVPPRDFLMRTIHYFADPKIGVVQTRWSYLNRHYNMLTEIEAILLDGHFILEHCARSGSGKFFNFNGTAGILRATMIEDAGGWQHDTLTEDSDLSYRAQLKGWKFIYVPSIDCPSELPVDTYSFQVQQSRWAKGLTQTSLKLLPRVMKAKIPLTHKLEAFMHLTPNISYPLMLLITILMWPVTIVRFYMGWFQMVTIDLPLLIATFTSMSAFYVVSQYELNRKSWKRSVLLLPFLMSTGVALTLVNAKAVMEALFGIKSAFARTPKYAVGEQKAVAKAVKYRRRSGWLPWAELAIGTYFVFMIAYSIETWNYFAIPFLLMFVGGYYWAGFTTLFQEYQGRIRWMRQRRLEAVAAAATENASAQ